MLYDFLYMTNHDPQCLHICLHPKEDNDTRTKDEENGDEDGHDDIVEDDGPLETLPRDRRAMAYVRSRMANEMYVAYRRAPWYRR